MENLRTKLNSLSEQKTFLIFAALSFLFRLPSLFIGYADIDEVLWGLFANAVVDGGTPYHTVIGEKPPLLYLVYAAVFKIFGKHNYVAIHVLGILWAALTGFFIYRFVTRYSDKTAAWIAGVAYVIFSSAAGFRMQATTGELLMNLPLVLSCIFFLRGVKTESKLNLILAGVMATTAALFRQQSMIQFGAFFLFLIFLWGQDFSIKKIFARIITPSFYLGLGGIIPILLCWFYIEETHSTEDFLFWVFQHNYYYIKSGFLNGAVMRNFFVRTAHTIVMTLPIWIFGFLRIKKVVSDFLKKKILNDFEIFVLIYLLVSLIAVFPGGRFFPHYFLQAFPALCILAALEFCEIRIWKRAGTETRPYEYTLVAIYLVFLLIHLLFIPVEMHKNDPGDYAPLNKIVGTYIKEHSAKDDKIFIWGWCQGIYYYSERDPAARFISSDFLSGYSPSQNNSAALDTTANITPGSWDMLFADFSVQKPLYILDTSPGNYHDYGIYPIKKFPLLEKYIATNYVFEKNLEGIDLYRLK